MECIRFSEKVISWFKSYLRGRTFKVNTDTKFLGPRKFIWGVPQYLIYIRQAVKCELFIFVDATFLTFQLENVWNQWRRVFLIKSTLDFYFFIDKTDS